MQLPHHVEIPGGGVVGITTAPANALCRAVGVILYHQIVGDDEWVDEGPRGWRKPVGVRVGRQASIFHQIKLEGKLAGRSSGTAAEVKPVAAGILDPVVLHRAGVAVADAEADLVGATSEVALEIVVEGIALDQYVTVDAALKHQHVPGGHSVLLEIAIAQREEARHRGIDPDLPPAARGKVIAVDGRTRAPHVDGVVAAAALVERQGGISADARGVFKSQTSGAPHVVVHSGHLPRRPHLIDPMRAPSRTTRH